MAEKEGLTFLGSLPVDTELVTLLDAAEGAERNLEETQDGPNGDAPFALLSRYLKTSSWPLFKEIVAKALANITETEQSETIPSA